VIFREGAVVRLKTSGIPILLFFILAIFAGCDQFTSRNLGGPGSVRTNLGGPATVPSDLRDRGFLGVRLVSDPGSDVDAVVAAVIPGAAATRVGIQGQDTIQKVDGAAIKGRDEFLALAKNWKPGQVILLEVARGERTLNFQVRLMTFDEYLPLLQATGE
jgi:S1-C subfamily serine protease